MASWGGLVLFCSHPPHEASGVCAQSGAARQALRPTLAGQKGAVHLDDPSLYVNRELSWLEFNRRVLEEAQEPLTPTLEKLKFASIFSSNLDEYFMVRVGGLSRIRIAEVDGIDASGRTVRQQLDEIAEKVRGLVAEQYGCIMDEVLPRLKKVGVFLQRIEELDKKERKRLEEYFEAQVFPIPTPLAVDAGHPFPFLANLRLNLMTVFGRSTVYFNHGLDPKIKQRNLGKADLRLDEFGIWAETILEERDEYEKFLVSLGKAGKLGWSSGTAPHLRA